MRILHDGCPGRKSPLLPPHKLQEVGEDSSVFQSALDDAQKLPANAWAPFAATRRVFMHSYELF
jgi:hypothetical protein